MVQLIKPTQIITQQGEIKVTISLDLNINLQSGEITIKTVDKAKEELVKERETEWAIPDFSNNVKVNFGK